MTTRILRERDACFQCIWAHNTYFRRHVDELDARPRVECRITGRQGKLYCDACQLSHHACEKVAPARQGDVHDLFALLEWSDWVLAHKSIIHLRGRELEFPFWTDNDRRLILKAAVDLLKGFRESEDMHREAHGLNVRKQTREANGTTARYNVFVTARAAALDNQNPAPINPESARLPRLAYGDDGFLPFAIAKNSFGRTIIRMLEQKDMGTMQIFRGHLPAGVMIFS
ncbi:hypothetical protein NKR19_g9260 [Coniochaeta hoffmannii]|uniref:Uncharacterized protein n=1 Tax=Coniochaeta hoffmannii TaxID=91930 RepID=A0AA38R3F3_9PEZI|nr:hypothetical protein NKR19_g9260 [Coniochaeta hoffmannii]